MYELPQIKFPKFSLSKIRIFRNRLFWLVVLVMFISSLFGFLAGLVAFTYYSHGLKKYFQKLDFFPLVPSKIVEKEKVVEKKYLPQTSEEEKIIEVVKKTSPAVVSIFVTKNVPVFKEYYFDPFGEFPFEDEEFFLFPLPFKEWRQEGYEEKRVGAGTGFIISEDGMVLTNKHVVLEKDAKYTILTNDGKKFPAKVLARDPFQDLAILKIESNGPFPVVKLGDSSKLQVGQTVIAIGNALGELRNTVSVGVISGLGRRIVASGGGYWETLEDVIQTDAALNPGNSGGPLLNLNGEVIGINVAMVKGGQTIGFAIPINKAKRDIEEVKNSGKITYPYLGVYYAILNKEIKKKYNLPVDYGALIGWNPVPGKKNEIFRTKIGVVEGSAAEKAGLKRDDIILEFNGEKITTANPLAKIIMKYRPGDKVILKVLRNKKIITLEATLGERSE